jgi:hypothetical protein
MISSKIILISTIVLLFLAFAFVMISITFDIFVNKDELKFFLGGLASGFTSISLIPIAEIETEYTPSWYEPH